MKRIFIELSLLAQIVALLPRVEYNAAWDLSDEKTRPGLTTDNVDLTQLPEGEVHVTFDNDGRHLFLVNHEGQLNYLHAISADGYPEGTVMLYFEGSQVVADVLETAADGGGVSVDALAAFFVFFGPEEVATMLRAMIEQLDAEARAETVVGPTAQVDADVVGAGVQVANDNSIEAFMEIEARSPKSAQTLRRLQELQGMNPRELPERERTKVVLLRLDTPAKKVAAGTVVVGVAGLALYGLARLCGK